FLQSDIDSFEKYRTKLDNKTRDGDVEVAYEIYSVFRERFNERMSYIENTLLDKTYDFNKKEYYETDRSEVAWAKSSAELDDIWRKIIKSQYLSLKLAKKEQKEIKESVSKRYERFQKSIGQYNSEDIFQIYMTALAEAYDPHTNYLSPSVAERFRTSISLSLEGIGARLQTENDYTKVMEIIPGGPADKSDLIHDGDRIIGVAQGEDGEMVDVIGWRIDDVVKLIKGPKGTKVRLQILPAKTGVSGPSEEIRLVREKIKIEDQAAKKEVHNIIKDGKPYRMGVITIPTFYMDFDEYQKGNPDYNSTTKDVKKLIKSLTAENVDGILIDLRNNGGGSLAEAIDLTGLFIKDGPVVQVKDSRNQIDVLNDDDADLLYNGPLTVLINRFSASASEIFAGAIQDYNRGVVVGEQSYGKGTVQTIVDLGRFIQDKELEVGQLKLTYQKFYRVSGGSTQNLGVEPDVKLPSAFDADKFGERSIPNALPWDEIKRAGFQKTDKISGQLVAKLNKEYTQRLKTDRGLQTLVEDTRELRRNIENTRISLNEQERKKEMEEAEKKKAKRDNDKLSGTSINTETGAIKDKIEVEDEYLREGIIVLAELINSKIG
ncbi:MAG: carboxy terminal-processing peptidase, partial [Bacteroidota bacterium]